MALLKCILVPQCEAYSAQDGQETISVQLDGGAGRYRRDISGATSRVTARWSLSREKWFYLRSLYRSVTASGSLPFLIDLILDDVVVTEHTAYFVPGTMRTDNKTGPIYVASCELEVVPLAITACLSNYACMVGGFGWYGVDGWECEGVLDSLMNDDWFGVLPA